MTYISQNERPGANHEHQLLLDGAKKPTSISKRNFTMDGYRLQALIMFKFLWVGLKAAQKRPRIYLRNKSQPFFLPFR